MSLSATLPAGPLARVHPLDPEVLAHGPADLAQSMRHREIGDDRAECWRWHLAHAEALQLSPAARAALIVATDRLQALQHAQEALEAAGEALAVELERTAT